MGGDRMSHYFTCLLYTSSDLDKLTDGVDDLKDATAKILDLSLIHIYYGTEYRTENTE